MAAKPIRTTCKFVLAILLTGIVWTSWEPPLQAQIGKRTIDNATQLRYLLPVPPKTGPMVAALLCEDLAQVPQVHLQEPVIVAVPFKEEDLSEPEKAQLRAAREKALNQNLGLIARIRSLNEKKTDHFLEI